MEGLGVHEQSLETSKKIHEFCVTNNRLCLDNKNKILSIVEYLMSQPNFKTNRDNHDNTDSQYDGETLGDLL